MIKSYAPLAFALQRRAIFIFALSVLFAALGLIFFVSFFSTTFFSFPDDVFMKGLVLFAIGFFGLCAGILVRSGKRFLAIRDLWWQREAKRQAIVEGNGDAYLASSQPLPGNVGIALPVMIRLTIAPTAKKWRIGIVCLLAFYFLPLVILQLSPFLMIGPLMLILFLVWATFTYTRRVLFATPEWTITEQGLLYNISSLYTVFISWTDICLIALTGDQKYEMPNGFEIASQDGSIEMMWYRPQQAKVMRRFVPLITVEAYNAHIDAVLAYVIARTGLALYDVRDDA